MTTNFAAATVSASLDQVFVKSFREFRASSKTFSERAVKVVRLALNRAIDNKSTAEWQYLLDQLAAKQAKGAPARKDLLSATAKTALRKAIRIGLALVAGEPVDGKDKPTFRISEETLNAPIEEVIDGRLRHWQSRRAAFINLDAVSVQVVKEAPDAAALLKRFAHAANACLAGGWTLEELIDLLKEAEQETPKQAA